MQSFACKHLSFIFLALGDGITPPQKVLFPSEKICLKWQQTHRVGAGLQNLGNTCFANAALQCLTYTPPLANYMLSHEHSKTCKCPVSFHAPCCGTLTYFHFFFPPKWKWGIKARILRLLRSWFIPLKAMEEDFRFVFRLHKKHFAPNSICEFRTPPAGFLHLLENVTWKSAPGQLDSSGQAGLRTPASQASTPPCKAWFIDRLGSLVERNLWPMPPASWKVTQGFPFSVRGLSSQP